MAAPDRTVDGIVAPSTGVGLSKPRQITPEPSPPTSVHGPLVEVANWSLNVSPAATALSPTSIESRMRETSALVTPVAGVFSAALGVVGVRASILSYHR